MTTTYHIGDFVVPNFDPDEGDNIGDSDDSNFDFDVTLAPPDQPDPIDPPSPSPELPAARPLRDSNRRPVLGDTLSPQVAAYFYDLVAASLESGLVPMDAVKRASEAYVEARSWARRTRAKARDIDRVKQLLLSSVRARGHESGTMLAFRAIEAYNIITTGRIKLPTRPIRQPNRKKPKSVWYSAITDEELEER